MPAEAPLECVFAFFARGGMQFIAWYSAFISGVGTAEYLRPMSASYRKMHRPLNPEAMGMYGSSAGFCRMRRL